jgi:hypothetical protein
MKVIVKKRFPPIWIFAVLIVAASAIASCNKSSGNSTGSYSVSFKVNGVQKQFTIQAVAAFATLSSTYYTASVSGANSLVSGSSGMLISISNPGAITTGVNYTDADVSIQGNEIPQAVLQYIDSAGNTYASTFLGSPNVSVSFSEINNTVAKGTFSGTVQLQSGGIPISITEGQFVVVANR